MLYEWVCKWIPVLKPKAKTGIIHHAIGIGHARRHVRRAMTAKAFSLSCVLVPVAGATVTSPYWVPPLYDRVIGYGPAGTDLPYIVTGPNGEIIAAGPGSVVTTVPTGTSIPNEIPISGTTPQPVPEPSSLILLLTPIALLLYLRRR